MCGHFCLIKKPRGGRELGRVAPILPGKGFPHIVGTRSLCKTYIKIVLAELAG